MREAAEAVRSRFSEDSPAPVQKPTQLSWNTWAVDFLMLSSTPVAAARSLTLCEAQSGFHGTACIGSLENRYAPGGASRPTARGPRRPSPGARR